MIPQINRFVDPLIDSWSLMGTPYPLMSIFAVYLWVVLKAGPKYMENRKAFNLSNVTRVYNFFQVTACALGIIWACQMGFSFKFAWQCLPLPKASDEISPVMLTYYNCYWYFMLFRLFEFVETLFFVLRKKQNQVSFLHLYHHIAVVALLWMFLKYSGSVSEGFIGFLNSCVHCVMYSYYFLSSFDSLKKFTVKIKPFLTAIQIVQLLSLIVHCFRALVSCGASKLYYLQILNLVLLVSMFTRFYFKNYLLGKGKKE